MDEHLDILDMKSSLLDDEMLIIKRKSERFAYFLFIMTQIVWATQGTQLKSFHILFPGLYYIHSFTFWRNLMMTSLGYYICYYKKIKIIKPSEIKVRHWFYVRNIGIYICISTWMQVLSYFRLSTCQIVGSISPIIVILLSIIILKDSFYMRYIYGSIICLIGACMIILNERNPETNNKNFDDNIFAGIICFIINQTMFSFVNIGQKKVTQERISSEVQTFYFGLYSLIISFCFCFIYQDFGFRNWKYCLYCIGNGLLFYIGNYYTTESFKYIQISKLMPINYLGTVFTVVLGCIVFKEKLFFSDIIGASMIIGFVTYNGIYPPQSKKKKENEKK